jgi:Na+-translocating ferredoxin:NAD+ oxidoreductase RnfD subunit
MILKKIWNASIYYHVIFVLMVLAVAGTFRHGLQTLPQIGIAVAAAVLFDYLFVLMKSKSHFFSLSAIISGLIIALVLKPGIHWYIPLLAALIAILSKHAVKIKGRHIFNPANLGLFITGLIFHAHLFWWGGEILWLTIVLGLFVAYQLKRIPLVLTYIAVQFVFLAIYYYTQDIAIIKAFYMINFFFVFIMLIEPKTAPLLRWGRIVYGVLTAVIASVLMSFGHLHIDPAVTALVIADLFVPILNWKVLKGIEKY